MPGFGLAETAELAVRISLKDDLSRGINGLTGKINRLDSGLGRVGKGVGQVGAGFARAGLLVGGAAITGLTAAGKAAIDFEDAFAGVRKTVDEADLAAAGLTFDDLARSFRDMATEIPIAATELAAIGETAGALGIHAADIDDFAEVVAKLGVTTDLSSDQAAEALGKVGTILGLTGKDFETFADTLVNLGNKGASTESEIIEVTKRFAAMGRQAGLTNDQILALSSAATSLGAEPEAAGSALSRIFANLSTEIANGTKKGKAFSKITGDSMDELRKRINRGDALGIMLETLEGISGLSRTKAASVLKALGITNVRDRNAILLMSQNLGFVNEQLELASDSTGALGTEARKRFDTVASKIQLLKNNLIEAGITIGEGMAPAIGRAAERLSEFLRQGENVETLKAIGEDVGKAIDGINWNDVLRNAREFVGVMKGALSFAKLLLDAFNALPGEIKGATAGLLALNKLSGGLIGAGAGNIIGGLGETAARSAGSRLPGIGKLFAQPVFVTNWPPGMGLGGGVAGGGKSLLGTALKVAIPAAVLVGALEQVHSNLIMPGLQQQAGQNIANTQGIAASGNAKLIADEIARLKSLPDQLDPLKRVLYDLNAQGVKVHTESLIAELERAQSSTQHEGGQAAILRDEQAKTRIAIDKQYTAVENMRTGIDSSLGNVKTSVDSAAVGQSVRDASQKAAIDQTKVATINAGARAANASASAASRIVGAIWAARPVVNVSSTTVNRTTVVSDRGGPRSGDRARAA